MAYICYSINRVSTGTHSRQAEDSYMSKSFSFARVTIAAAFMVGMLPSAQADTREAQATTSAHAQSWPKTRTIKKTTDCGPWYLCDSFRVTRTWVGGSKPWKFEQWRQSNRTDYVWPYSKRGAVKHTGISLKSVSNGYVKSTSYPSNITYLRTSDGHAKFTYKVRVSGDKDVSALRNKTVYKTVTIDFGK